MFTERLSAEPISSCVTGNYGRIVADVYYSEDTTMFATMKLLIGDRLNTDERLYYYAKTYDYNNTSFINAKRFLLDRSILYEYNGSSTFQLIKLKGFDWSSFLISMNECRDYLVDKWSVKRHSAAELYCKQHGINAIVFTYNIQDFENGVVLYDDSSITSVKMWHFVQSIIPVVIPHYFKDKPITDIEKELLDSLTQTTPNKYLEVFGRIVDSLDLRTKFLDDMLKGFDAKLINTKIESQKTVVRNIQRDIESYLSMLSDAYKRLETNQILLSGLVNRETDYNEPDELLNYFKDNKALELRRVEGNTLTLKVITYMDNFNPDVYETLINNKRSCIYTSVPDVSSNDIELLMNAVFLDQKVRIKVRSQLKLSAGGDGYGAYINWCNIDSCDSDVNSIRNPHLYHHNCFGNNGPEIIRLLSEGDYISALSMCISSTGNINFGDGYVVPEFMNDIFYDMVACFEMPDGTMLNAYKCIRALKGEPINE